MRYTLLFIFFLGISNINAQSLNNYKYIIVPEKFEFSKSENQYKLNALAKFLFEKEGYETLMKKEARPVDLRNDPCLGLKLDVENNSGLFSTKFVINLEDCQGKTVFTSEEGYSREKDYEKAWHEAFRDAFESVKELNYSYDADAAIVSKSQMNKEEEPKAVKESEVAQSAPEDGPQPDENRRDDKNDSEKAVENPASMYFERAGTAYKLEENEKGYQLFQEGALEPQAVLLKSQSGDNYIYNSLTRQGMAYFTENGDLVVEHYDSEQDNTVITTFRAIE